eukprot:1306215-Alexandrium_andersonii.AAC.1
MCVPFQGFLLSGTQRGAHHAPGRAAVEILPVHHCLQGKDGGLADSLPSSLLDKGSRDDDPDRGQPRAVCGGGRARRDRLRSAREERQPTG